MTEKRFTDVEVDKYYGLICMNHDGQFHSYSEQSLEDLLNHLHEENQRLKRQICNLEHIRDFCAECCERLEKENEQLKSEIREVRGEYEQLWMRFYDY